MSTSDAGRQPCATCNLHPSWLVASLEATVNVNSATTEKALGNTKSSLERISYIMPPIQTSHHDQSRVDLAHALEFADYSHSKAAEPYLNYISNRHMGRGTLSQYNSLFVRIVTHFIGYGGRVQTPFSIQSFLDLMNDSFESVFIDTPPGSKTRKEDVEDTVLYILGVWSLMLSSFVRMPTGARRVAVAFQEFHLGNTGLDDIWKETPAALIKGSCLIPSSRPSQLPQTVNEDAEILDTASRLVRLLSSSRISTCSTGEQHSFAASSITPPNSQLLFSNASGVQTRPTA